jgi:hypothetical protein
MRSAKIILVAGFMLLSAGLAKADNITPPPDGDVGVLGGSDSVQITSLAFGLTFLPCSNSIVAADCALIASETGTAPQEAFGGVNDTGEAWNTLQIEVTLPSWDPTTESLGCSGGNFFSINNCAQVNLDLVDSSSPQTVTIQFGQGTGTGIGCFDTVYSNQTAFNANVNCAINSAVNYNFGSPTGLYDNPFVSSCNSLDEVCGGSDFVVAIGYGGDPFPTGPTDNSLPDANASAGANGAPVSEPSTLLCLCAGLLGILSMGWARKKLAATA